MVSPAKCTVPVLLYKHNWSSRKLLDLRYTSIHQRYWEIAHHSWDVHTTLFVPNQSEYLIIFCLWAINKPTQNFLSSNSIGETLAKQDYQLTGVKETVSSGMQSYASVVKNSCSEILPTKKVTAAVKSAIEADDRSENVIIFRFSKNRLQKLFWKKRRRYFPF